MDGCPAEPGLSSDLPDKRNDIKELNSSNRRSVVDLRTVGLETGLSVGGRLVGAAAYADPPSVRDGLESDAAPEHPSAPLNSRQESQQSVSVSPRTPGDS